MDDVQPGRKEKKGKDERGGEVKYKARKLTFRPQGLK